MDFLDKFLVGAVYTAVIMIGHHISPVTMAVVISSLIIYKPLIK